MKINREPGSSGKAGVREIWGLALLIASVLMLLAFVSYQPADIPFIKTPPNSPPFNYIGPVGAWFVFACLMTFGLTALLFPFLAAGLGLLLLLRREEPVKSWLLWGACAVLAASALLAINVDSGERIAARFNVAGFTGGMGGWLIGDRLLAGLFGDTGATVILFGLLLSAFVMCFGLKKIAAAAVGLAVFFRLLNIKIAALIDARRDRLDKIVVEEKEIARKRAAIEKALRKEKAVQPAEPAVVDTVVTIVPPRIDPAPDKPPEKPRREKPAPVPAESPGEVPARAPARPGEYQLPPLDLLQPLPAGNDRAMPDNQLTTSKILQETLAEFGITCEVKHVEQGPVVTRYELLPAPGVRVEKIGSLANNIALTLKATSIRIQAPVPGKGVVGIEVPNSSATKVYLRELLEGETWKNSRAEIPIVLGKDVGGKDIIPDLSAMPHLLIAGATGSGKTVCMNSILAGLLMSRTPEQLRLMLIDPKLIEFAAYNELPHLIVPVITDPKKVAFGLRWAITEMEKRYKLFARAGVRNIQGFNSRPVEQDLIPKASPENGAEEDKIPPRLPYIVIVIDELADLMMVAQADVENHIARLAQLSRAVGIHMILATQRPSVNIITGTIKANFPARLSFQVAQKVDSRTILDTVGADKLLGRGDMLFLQPTSSKLVRAQGALTSDDDINAIVNFIKLRYPPNYELAIKQHIEKTGDIESFDEDGVDDDLLQTAIQIIRETRRASVSLLQRRMKIGYNRAGRLMDKLEEQGIVGPVHGSDPREILIDLDTQMPESDEKQPQGES
ncbi:MAG: DNA translocase FtsK 4TM domain-containing protein [Kiritimatiellia bacterium]